MSLDSETKAVLSVIMFLVVLVLLSAFYYSNKDIGKQEMLNKLCSMTKYDFCVPKQEWDLRK